MENVYICTNQYSVCGRPDEVTEHSSSEEKPLENFLSAVMMIVSE